jgi:hypothetical protein
MRTVARATVVMGVVWCAMQTAPLAAQSPAPQQPPIIYGPPLPPATALEGFRQPIGSMLTLGFDDLGEVDGVFVDVREMRDSRGNRARGIVVEIAGAQNVREQSFVDADEIPGLLKAIDDLVAITANPTQFKSFEIRYMTRGEMGLTASSSRNRGIFYGIEVGRLTKARKAISAGEMHQLRTLFEAASQKLATLVADK